MVALAVMTGILLCAVVVGGLWVRAEIAALRREAVEATYSITSSIDALRSACRNQIEDVQAHLKRLQNQMDERMPRRNVLPRSMGDVRREAEAGKLPEDRF